MTDDLDNSDRSSESLRKAKKYLFFGAIVFGVLALPESRFQDLFRIVVWTIAVLGTITALVFPFLRDLVSRATLAAMYLFHFATVYLFYDRIPHSDYIVIGIFGLIEIICLLLPMAWLELRHKRHHSLAATAEHDPDLEKRS